jgi:hypothetical protein
VSGALVWKILGHLADEYDIERNTSEACGVTRVKPLMKVAYSTDDEVRCSHVWVADLMWSLVEDESREVQQDEEVEGVLVGPVSEVVEESKIEGTSFGVCARAAELHDTRAHHNLKPVVRVVEVVVRDGMSDRERDERLQSGRGSRG